MRLLHRKEVAKLMGVSHATVRNLDGSLLHPTVNSDGVYEYTREDVNKAILAYGKRKSKKSRNRREQNLGRKAAEAFIMFAAGEGLAAVVTALEVTPAQVKQWWRDYQGGYPGPVGSSLASSRYAPVAPRPGSAEALLAENVSSELLGASSVPGGDLSIKTDPKHESDLAEALAAFAPKKKI
jgi:hypothetical protein